MKGRVMWLLVAGLMASGARAEELPIAPEDWFERASGYEEALELQKEIGADMLLFIASRSPAGPTRRSREFEYDVLRHRDMENFLKHYIVVKLTIPTERETNDLADERYHVKHGPRVFVVRPNGFAMPLGIHERDGDHRTLLPIETIQRRIVMASSDVYKKHPDLVSPAE